MTADSEDMPAIAVKMPGIMLMARRMCAKFMRAGDSRASLGMFIMLADMAVIMAIEMFINLCSDVAMPLAPGFFHILRLLAGIFFIHSRFTTRAAAQAAP